MWIDAIIMPREESGASLPPPRGDRRAVYAAGCAQSLQFRAAVLRYLRTHRLMGAVQAVSEPGSLPIVTLRCQERVLEQLRQAPQFEAGRSLALELRA